MLNFCTELHLVRGRIQCALVVLPECLQWVLHPIAYFVQGRHGLCHASIGPVHLVQCLDVCGYDIGSLRFLEWMAAEHLLADLRWTLVNSLKQINQGVPIGAVQSEHVFVARHRNFGHVLAELYPGLVVYLDHLVYAAEGWLSLASHWEGRVE